VGIEKREKEKEKREKRKEGKGEKQCLSEKRIGGLS